MALDIDITPITIEELTEGKIDGNGVFDSLMRSINAHLLNEYTKDRIDGNSYGEVYLGSIQAAISQSIQFLLSKDKSSLDAALIEAQTRKIDSEIELIGVQRQIAEIEKDRTEAQIRKINQDIAFSQAQQKNIEAENQKIIAEVELAQAQAKIAEKQLIVMDSTVLKAEKEVELMDAELARQPTLLAKLIAETELIGQQGEKVEQEVANLLATLERINAEVALLKQKTITEEAQTTSGASGVIGAQVSLYNAQRQGFSDDAKVKKVKAANDVYAIAKSNDPNAVSDPTNMNSTLEAALNQLLS